MNKLILLLISTFITLNSYGQENSYVLELEGYTQTQIMDVTNQWAAEALSDANSMIKGSSSTSITIKAEQKFNAGFNSTFAGGHISYTIVVKTKDGKARIQVKSIYHKSSMGSKYDFPMDKTLVLRSSWNCGYSKKQQKKMHAKLMQDIPKLVIHTIDSYRNYIENNLAVDNDW